MEQEQIIVPEYLSSSPVWCRVHVAQCLVFCVVFRRSLFAPLSCIGHYIICVCSFVLYWPLYYLCLFLCPVLAITLFVFVPLSCIGHYIICVCSFVLYWALYYLCLFLCPVLAIILFVRRHTASEYPIWRLQVFFIIPKLLCGWSDFANTNVFKVPKLSWQYKNILSVKNRIDGLMVIVCAHRTTDSGLEPMSIVKTKNCKIGMCCFSAKYVTFRGMRIDLLAGNQDNVSERNYHNKNPTKRIGLVQSGHHHRHLFEM